VRCKLRALHGFWLRGGGQGVFLGFSEGLALQCAAGPLYGRDGECRSGTQGGAASRVSNASVAGSLHEIAMRRAVLHPVGTGRDMLARPWHLSPLLLQSCNARGSISLLVRPGRYYQLCPCVRPLSAGMSCTLVLVRWHVAALYREGCIVCCPAASPPLACVYAPVCV